MSDHRIPRRISVVIAALLIVSASAAVGFAVAPSNQDQYPDDTALSVPSTSTHNGTINSPSDTDKIKTTLDKGEYITVSVLVPEEESRFVVSLQSDSEYYVKNITNAESESYNSPRVVGISGDIVATFEIWAEENDATIEMSLYERFGSGEVPYNWELTTELNSPRPSTVNPPPGFSNTNPEPIPDPVQDEYPDGEATRIDPSTSVNGVLNSPSDRDDLEFVLRKGEYVTVSVLVPEEESRFVVSLQSDSEYYVKNITNAESESYNSPRVVGISGDIVATFEIWAESTGVIDLSLYERFGSGEVPYEWYLSLNKNSPRPATVRPSGSNVDINVTVSGSDSTKSFREGQEITASATSNDADVSDLEVTYKGNSKRLGDDRTASFRLSGTGNQQLEFTYENVTQTAELEVAPKLSDENLDIDETSLNINPFPVPTGDAPTVSVNATGATNMFVNVTVDGQRGSVRMQNVDSDRWEADLSKLDAPDMDGLGRGSRVELSIVACDGPCTPETKTVLKRTKQAFPETGLPVDADTAQYEYQADQKRPLHYFVFDQVVEIPVILVDFSGGLTPEEYGYDAANVTQWEKAREYDLNSFFGSDRGTMGSVGFDLVYYDNGGEFYEVQSRSSYDFLTTNARTDVEVARFTDDARRTALPDMAPDKEYIVTHPGSEWGALALNGSSDSLYPGSRERAYADMTVLDHYGVWAEEIAHLKLGMTDLYPRGFITRNLNAKYLKGSGTEVGLMASQNGEFRQRLPDSFNVISRTRYNTAETLTNEDENRPWADTVERTVSRSGQSSTTVTVERPNNTRLGDTVEVVDTGVQKPNGQAKYAFQLNATSNRVQAFELVERDGELRALHSVAPEGIDSRTRDHLKGAVLTEFTTDYSRTDGETRAAVSVSLVPPDPDRRLASLRSLSLPSVGESLGERPDATPPDADLRAVDGQGRVTGVTEDGEFVNEIPGANASGDRVQGPEWISVPSDADVDFEVSTADAQQFVNETNVSEENATISYTTEVTEVGENPQLVTENGTVRVTNTTTTTTNESAEPGETKQVSTGFSVAEYDRDNNGQIGFTDLLFALEDYNNKEITFVQLLRVLRAYNTGASV